MLVPHLPALILAPMQGLTDAPMRAYQSESGAFTFAVSEFLRISGDVPSAKMFFRHVPELHCGGRTPAGLPVQVQLLGGDAGRMAASAVVAYEAGAKAVDINFGCPAPTVNRHDGGAALLKYPSRIQEIVAAIRGALPLEIPVSAKLRLGWDSADSIFENAERAAAGGASWITIHGRTRVQGYAPPADWVRIGQVRDQLSIPVVANGDLWSIDDFKRCRDMTGCTQFMLGRGALANPYLPQQVACELGIATKACTDEESGPIDWVPHLNRLIALTAQIEGKSLVDKRSDHFLVCRLKQWLNLADKQGQFTEFEAVKRLETTAELFAFLGESKAPQPPIMGEPDFQAVSVPPLLGARGF
ncbi:MAG: tRNA dihydrouridine synthase [Janthinobacterium lividum]